MKLDPKRLARQQECFDNWRKNKARGIIEAVTGFGKTYIIVLAIKYMNKYHPDRTAIVLVPSTQLKEDWIGNENKQGHIKEHGLLNVRVFVLNTFVKYKDWRCDLLAVDECHRIANQESQHFSTALSITNYKYIMCMTATLEKNHKEFFKKVGLDVVDTVDTAEAQRCGFIAPSLVYNLGIQPSQQDKEFMAKLDKTFKYYFAYFNHEFKLVQACSGSAATIHVTLRNGTYLGAKTGRAWADWFARRNGWDNSPSHPYAPQNVIKASVQCMNAMRKRKAALQNYSSKLEVAVKLMEKFDVPTLTFSETSEFADKLADMLPNKCLSYHSNLNSIAVKEDIVIKILNGREESKHYKDQGFTILGKKKRREEIIRRFLDPKDSVNKLSTVRAMQEGVDFPGVEFILMLAYNSKKLRDVQTTGRGKRLDYNNENKKALIVNLYMLGTQEEKWLRSKQIGGEAATYVTSIDEISLNHTITFGDGPKELVLDEQGNEIVPVSDHT